MEKSVKNTSIIAATLIAITLIVVFSGIGKNNSTYTDVITVNGNGEISVIPDQVGLYFSVEGKGLDSKSAKDENSRNTEKLIFSLMELGFERKEIQTTNYNIYEDFDWSQTGRKSLGYKASQNIVLKISSQDSEMIGKVIDVGVDEGVTLSYINFELTKKLENEYKAEAVKLAAEDAKMQAEALASGVGKKIGKLISVSNQDSYYPPLRMYDYALGVDSEENMEMAKSAVSIEPSERKISATVSVVYRIK